MEEWVKAAVADKYIAAVEPAKVQSGVFCEAFTSPWYDGGVVFDWTTLHQRLVRPATTTASVDGAVSALRRSGVAALERVAGDGARQCFATSVEIGKPWALHPLSDQAQQLSVFDVPPPRSASASPPTPARQLYTFLRGPPGQRAVRDDMARVLASAEAQLRDKGVAVVRFLSSFVLFGDDFTDMLHSTAAVFQALREVGFAVDGHGSCLGPRTVSGLRVDAEAWWTTAPLSTMKTEEAVSAFLVALFFQWLQDAYVWACTAPLRLFPSAGAPAEAETVKAKSVRLFERFVRGLVLPRARAIGLDAVYAALPEEGGSLFDLAALGLERKKPPVGPQPWSVAELRVVLSQIGAYAHVPSEYLSVPLAPAAAKSQ